MLKQACLLTRPTSAARSPSRPEPAKTDLLPKNAPFRVQGRSERRGEEARRYGPHFVGPFAFVIDLGERKSPSSASDFRTTLGEPLSEARTLPAEFFSILLDLSADRLLSLDPRG